ncbi:unnamed protein product [Fusarium graminearum]|nr:unnamed protein product [Fusarium graminearum]
MKLFIWLWLCSIVSAACDINYAFWFPDFGMTVLGDLTPAIPDVGVPEFEKQNPGVKADKIQEGGAYKVPYSPEMVIIEPAIWSGKCTKTLLLRGEEKTQKAAMSSQVLTQPTTTLRKLPTSDTTYETRYDRTVTDTAALTTGQNEDSDISVTTASASHQIESSNADLYSATDPTDTSQTVQASDSTTKDDEQTTLTSITINSYTATGTTDRNPTEHVTDASSKPTTQTSAKTNAPTMKPWHCWAKEGDGSITKDKRVAMAKKFCKEVKETPLSSKISCHAQNQEQLHLAACLTPECNNQDVTLDEPACLLYFGGIEKECSSLGGYLQNDCTIVWITDLTSNS